MGGRPGAVEPKSFGRGVVREVRKGDGVRVVEVGGVTCYSHTGDTEVHDAMREVVRDIVTGESGLFPERKGADPAR